jgi:hypothetical protein
MLSDEGPPSTRVTSSGQLDHVLDVTEILLERAEQAATWCRALRATEVGVVALAVFVLTGWVGLSHDIGGARLVIVSVIGLLVSVFVSAAIYFLVEAPIRVRITRDATAIVDVVGLVRELMPLVAQHEKWNELQTHLMSSRLSRFPIGPKGIR